MHDPQSRPQKDQGTKHQGQRQMGGGCKHVLSGMGTQIDAKYGQTIGHHVRDDGGVDAVGHVH